MARNKYPEETIKLIVDTALRLFATKGYDDTSLQDIIDETKLSKGAIYHHFASKDDIFQAAGDRIGEENICILTAVIEDSSLNGRQKLSRIFETSVLNPNQKLVMSMMPNLLKNPKFLAMGIEDIFTMAPRFLLPILEEGNADGSLHVENPEQIAEMILLLANVWLNPLVNVPSVEVMRLRAQTYGKVFSAMGIDFIDVGIVDAYTTYVSDIIRTTQDREEAAAQETK